MRKQPTGEPDAGDPHVRFGGEGASAPLPNRILTGTAFWREPCGVNPSAHEPVAGVPERVLLWQAVWRRGGMLKESRARDRIIGWHATTKRS